MYFFLLLLSFILRSSLALLVFLLTGRCLLTWFSNVFISAIFVLKRQAQQTNGVWFIILMCIYYKTQEVMIHQDHFQSPWQCKEFNLYFPVLGIPVPTGQRSNREYSVLVSFLVHLLCLSPHKQEGDFSLSALCVSMAYVLMPEQIRSPVLCIVLHLHLTGKEQLVWVYGLLGEKLFSQCLKHTESLKHQSRWYNKNWEKSFVKLE